MESFLYIIKREFRMLFYNKAIFIFSVILPIISILFFNTLLSKGVPRDLPIAVVDLDNSALSRNLISQLDATPELKVNFKPVSQLEGENLIKEGKVYGLVTIPKNFGSDLKRGKQTKVINQYNSNILLASGLENKAFRKVVGTLSAGANIQKQIAKGTNINQAKANYQPITSGNHILSNPYTNYSYYLNSGFLTLFLQIFVILTTIYCFGADLKYSKGEKIYTIAKGNLLVIILAKTLPYTLWFLFIGIVMLYSMFVFQDFPLFGNKLIILLSLLLLIISTQAYSLFFIAISKSFREALTFGSGFAAVSLSFSGITFPIFGMPKIMQWLSQIFPFTHFFELFVDQTQRGIPIYYSVKSISLLIVLTIVLLAISYKKLTVLFKQGSFIQRT
ncbi:ABC-2 type transport system permease protein [Lutibacter agarilyticus]|uniref:ABC-2 type transport system permease protein n=1 Tax=Lutibacter agarilyticus TaxID=1109740 RepID=A0A238X4R6_9FLAO|nr:ABC transporter permease [Lutibacter agarilyticus]SNR53622.1 ABC-2 type transport system permease protein [Lutibacter agarilyticus]